jgi:hypothetical protein
MVAVSVTGEGRGRGEGEREKMRTRVREFEGTRVGAGYGFQGEASFTRTHWKEKNLARDHREPHSSTPRNKNSSSLL